MDGCVKGEGESKILSIRMWYSWFTDIILGRNVDKYSEERKFALQPVRPLLPLCRTLGPEKENIALELIACLKYNATTSGSGLLDFAPLRP